MDDVVLVAGRTRGPGTDAMTERSARALAAVHQDGTYPRPQLVRPEWCDLSGTWAFALGHERSAPDEVDFDLRITVPFPPESRASGLGRQEFHPVVWYRRTITRDELTQAGLSEERPRLLLHFGAVDQIAAVWLGGHYLGEHRGGQTPFTFDVSRIVADGDGPLELVVRATDDPSDVERPRGKQDWRERPHSIWYHRTTGIWQPVWLEAVPEVHVDRLVLASDVPRGVLQVTLELDQRPTEPIWVDLALYLADDSCIARHRVAASDRLVQVDLYIELLRNGQAHEELLWSPERPTLLGLAIDVASDAGVDRVASYAGLRRVAVEDREFLLNDRPYPLRGVLAQGYWPDSHLAASPDALRHEVEAIKRLGFNAARVHQKVEAPGFLYWADRLGLLVWGETANAYAFSDRAVKSLVTEWIEVVRRDRSHPCIVAWVPLNESWGVQHAAHSAQQREYARSLTSLTRALDDTRPVVSNDGWEHLDSDIWTVHDYTPHVSDLADRYGSADALLALLHGFGPSGRRIRLDDAVDRGQPFMLTEFGGVSYDPGGDVETWGYSTVDSREALERRLREILGAANAAIAVPGGLAGYCYTQLADTGQETNGLLFEDRTPKLPWEVLRELVLSMPPRPDLREPASARASSDAGLPVREPDPSAAGGPPADPSGSEGAPVPARETQGEDN